jgi:hypothetical protein
MRISGLAVRICTIAEVAMKRDAWLAVVTTPWEGRRASVPAAQVDFGGAAA